jgi:hypothetical protein
MHFLSCCCRSFRTNRFLSLRRRPEREAPGRWPALGLGSNQEDNGDDNRRATGGPSDSTV